MLWYDATKMLPPPDTAVLVRDGDDKFRYVLCSLFGDGFDIYFMPYESGCDCVDIRDGVLWALIKLPE